MFQAILIHKDENGYRSELVMLNESQLPEGDVTIRIDYSSINYKDALAITGKSPIIRQFPMVPGIDLAGTVIESQSDQHHPGEQVIVNGWGVGEQHWGGFAQKARMRSAWLTPLPQELSAKHAMAIGTAGYTAMLSVMALEVHGLTPSKGPVLVTGASGGVGSFAVALLSRLGYRVIASTGRPEETDYLCNVLGAAEILDRKILAEPGKPLQKEQWAGAVDCVGSHTLANVCASTKAQGIVAACGLAQGMDFSSTVAPFILRGITLAGINSVTRPYQNRVDAWQRLSQILDVSLLEKIYCEVSLDQVISTAPRLLEGKVRGRIVVNTHTSLL